MSWKDKLETGSFRGVEFLTESVSNSLGRRAQIHEYPNKDTPYAEDMGRKARDFTVDCYVLGEDYMDARNALIEALEKPGTGTLIHPYWGTQNVQAISVSVRESSDEGRMARFSISFTEAGENITPVEDIDTSAVLTENIDNGVIATINDFGEKFGVTGLPDYAVTDAKSIIDSALDTIAFAQDAVSAVQDIKANIDTAINNPLSLATDITGAMAAVGDNAVLTTLHTFGSTLLPIATASDIGAAMQQNQQAIINMVRSSATLETIRLIT